MQETIFWGIHGGRTGDADTLFLKKNTIAIGWVEMGNLSGLKPDRDAFKEAVAKVYPNAKPGAIPNYSGQLFRFVYEMKEGDYVVYPSKLDHMIHIGRVEGKYYHDTSGESTYPQRRPVKWLKVIPRTSLSQGALYELGAAKSFFQVKNYVDETIAALEGSTPSAPKVVHDPTVGLIAEEIVQNTHDFILKTLAQELKGHPFAEFAAHLLNTMDYRTRVSPEGPDGGVDIIAHKDELGFVPPVIKVQIKSIEGSSGEPEVSALYGKVGTNEFGLFITLGSFTKQAVNFAKSKPNLRLIDGEELVSLILAHYEDFDSRYKGILPLKRIYVPQPITEDSGE